MVAWKARGVGRRLALAIVLAAASIGGASAVARPAPSHFTGGLAVFGKAPTGSAEIHAYIGNIECGGGKLTGSAYALNVLSSQDKTGCGTEGVEVKFTVGDYWANETGQWSAAAFQQLDLSGPRLQSLSLAPGCNDDIKLTFSNGTTIADLVSFVQPADNLEAIWKRGNNAWQSYFPNGQDADNTLKTVNKNDLITVCVTDSAALSLPIAAPAPPAAARP